MFRFFFKNFSQKLKFLCQSASNETFLYGYFLNPHAQQFKTTQWAVHASYNIIGGVLECNTQYFIFI